MNTIDKMDPGLLAVIEPIIKSMQDLAYQKQFNPLVGQQPESMQERIAKRSCIHIYKNGADYEYALEKQKVQGEERYVCKLCGRPIHHKYDESSIKILLQALEVINGYVLMLPGYNINPNVMNMFLSIKNTWPELIKITQEANQFITLQERDSKTDTNMVADYNTGGILGMSGIL